jgi:hypothetical protein
MPTFDTLPVSRVREIRTHGLNGSLDLDAGNPGR